jgi:hypothetical protein
MLLVTALCSDEDCAEELSIEVETLEALDDSLCESGCTLVLLSVAELDLTGAI